jgi:hypothetical protein
VELILDLENPVLIIEALFAMRAKNQEQEKHVLNAFLILKNKNFLTDQSLEKHQNLIACTEITKHPIKELRSGENIAEYICTIALLKDSSERATFENDQLPLLRNYWKQWRPTNPQIIRSLKKALESMNKPFNPLAVELSFRLYKIQ